MKKIKLFPLFILCSMFLISCTNDSGVAPDPLYETVPDIDKCRPGSLSDIEKGKVLAYINSIRKTHNLPSVYDTVKTNVGFAQEIALIGAANGTVDGDVTEFDECYPEYTSTSTINLNNVNRSLWGSEKPDWPSSEVHINDWMTELDKDNVDNRRRLLDPFLKFITFGRVIGRPKKGDFNFVSSATLFTVDGNVDLSEYDKSYVAYPDGNYSAKLFDPDSFLSFSVLYDKSSKANNGYPTVDFSEATVTVSAGTQSLEIVGDTATYDYRKVGLPNNLQWKALGLTKNVAYTVRIRDVRVGIAGELKDYEYTFNFK
jgi:hypothetical protein